MPKGSGSAVWPNSPGPAGHRHGGEASASAGRVRKSASAPFPPEPAVPASVPASLGFTTPKGEKGTWYEVVCVRGTTPPGNVHWAPIIETGGPSGALFGYVFVQNGTATPGPKLTPPLLAEEAFSAKKLPSPGPLGFDPDRLGNVTGVTEVGIATWLWVTPAAWHPVTVDAAVPGLAVAVTARPVSVTWDLGNGASKTCDGPGQVYDFARPAAAQSSSCTYTYAHSSDGRDLAVSATITWDVTWSWTAGGVTHSGNTLPATTTTATAALRVTQVETVITSG